MGDPILGLKNSAPKWLREMEESGKLEVSE